MCMTGWWWLVVVVVGDLKESQQTIQEPLQDGDTIKIGIREIPNQSACCLMHSPILLEP